MDSNGFLAKTSSILIFTPILGRFPPNFGFGVPTHGENFAFYGTEYNTEMLSPTVFFLGNCGSIHYKKNRMSPFRDFPSTFAFSLFGFTLFVIQLCSYLACTVLLV